MLFKQVLADFWYKIDIWHRNDPVKKDHKIIPKCKFTLLKILLVFLPQIHIVI